MAEKYVLAVDLGTSALKLGLVSARGEIVGFETRPFEVHLLPGGGAEQDPEDWWSAIREATRALLARVPVRAEEVAAVTCTAQWSGTVPSTREGTPLGRALIWMDSRGAPHARRITGGRVQIEGYGVGRLATWIRRAGGVPSRSGKDPVAHILWLEHERPEIYRRAERFLEPADWLGLRLSGRAAATFATITLHWVTDNRDLGAVHYDDRLLRMAELDREKLPELVPPASVLGPIRPEAARELGLSEGVQVVAGTPDIQTAAVGSGAVRDYEPHLCLGTSSWLCCHVPFKKTDLLHGLASLPSALPGRWLLIDEQESAGACLAWLERTVLFDGAAPADPHRELDRLAEAAPPGSGRVIFAPWLNGERSPVDDRDARGLFFGLSLGTTRAHLARSVLEGVAYNTRWLLGPVERFVGRRLGAIRVVGGGARSDVWCQILADVLDRPIRRVAEPLRANVRGAGLIGAAALGWIGFEEVPERVPIEQTFEPDPANRRIYDELSSDLVRLYRGTRRVAARLHR